MDHPPQNPKPDAHGAQAATTPQSVRIASGGLTTLGDTGRFASALITDIMTEQVGHKMAGAAFRGTGLLLRIAEMRARHGSDLVIVDPRPDQAPERVSGGLEENALKIKAIRQLVS